MCYLALDQLLLSIHSGVVLAIEIVDRFMLSEEVSPPLQYALNELVFDRPDVCLQGRRTSFELSG